MQRNGTVVLNSGGHSSIVTFNSINCALNSFGMKLTMAPAPPGERSWSVSDGARFLKRFEDGMVRTPLRNWRLFEDFFWVAARRATALQ